MRIGALNSLYIVALGVSVAVAGCRSSEPQPSGQAASAQAASSADAAPASRIQLELDAAQKQAARQLAGKLRGGRFPGDVIRDPANAKLFLYLAATSEEPELIVAALQAMKMAYTLRAGPRALAHADDDYAAVVAAYLRSDNTKIQAQAIEAAAHSVRGPKPSRPVIDELVVIGTSHAHPGARAQAVALVQLVKDFAKDPKIAAALLQALDDKEAYVVSRALEGLRTWAANLPTQDRFLAKARQLIAHDNSAVRGRAAELAGRLGADTQGLVEQLVPLLDEKDPFVRSSAALALGHLGHLPSAHRIVKLLSDKEDNTYVFCCYTSLAGRKTRVAHRGSTWPQVRDAAINALARLSTRTEERFMPAQVDRDDVDGSLAKNAKTAKAWYLKVKAKLPTE
jgi:hypothetical protein